MNPIHIVAYSVPSRPMSSLARLYLKWTCTHNSCSSCSLTPTRRLHVDFGTPYVCDCGTSVQNYGNETSATLDKTKPNTVV